MFHPENFSLWPSCHLLNISSLTICYLFYKSTDMINLCHFRYLVYIYCCYFLLYRCDQFSLLFLEQNVSSDMLAIYRAVTFRFLCKYKYDQYIWHLLQTASLWPSCYLVNNYSYVTLHYSSITFSASMTNKLTFIPDCAMLLLDVYRYVAVCYLCH